MEFILSLALALDSKSIQTANLPQIRYEVKIVNKCVKSDQTFCGYVGSYVKKGDILLNSPKAQKSSDYPKLVTVEEFMY